MTSKTKPIYKYVITLLFTKYFFNKGQMWCCTESSFFYWALHILSRYLQYHKNEKPVTMRSLNYEKYKIHLVEMRDDVLH